METVRIGVLIDDRDYRNALLRGLSHESRDFQFIALDGRFGSYDDCEMVLTDREDIYRPTYLLGAPVRSEKKSVDPETSAVSDIVSVKKYGDRDGCKVKPSGIGQNGSLMVIHLTFHEMYDMSAIQRRMEIFRYEDARVFIGKIIYYYAKEKGIDLYFHGKRKCRTVVFSSLRGGVGTTSAAVTAARFLKYRFDKKTLFISLCPLDGSREFTGGSDGGNMLSLLYHLQAGDDVPLCKFISSSEGVDHIRGQINNRAASEMSCTELKKLMKMIDVAGCYDYLIVDLGTNWGHLSEYLIDRADVIVVVRSDRENRDDLTAGAGMLRNERNRSKIITVTEYDDYGVQGKQNQIASENGAGMSVKYDPAAFIHGKDRTYIDMRGTYGHDVSMLAEKIMERAD